MIVGTIEVPRIGKALLSALAAHLAERRRPGEPGQGGTWLHTFLSLYSFSFLPGGAPGAPGSDAPPPPLQILLAGARDRAGAAGVQFPGNRRSASASFPTLRAAPPTRLPASVHRRLFASPVHTGGLLLCPPVAGAKGEEPDPIPGLGAFLPGAALSSLSHRPTPEGCRFTPGRPPGRSLALNPGARWAPAGKESFPQTRVFRAWETRAPVHKRARRRRWEIGARIDVLPHFWRSQRLVGAGATPELPTRPVAETPDYKRRGVQGGGER